MRVFIAIDIDEVIRQDLADLQDEMRSKVDIKRSDAKWVNPDQMHLTLKFLGEIEDSQVINVCNITREIAQKHERFAMEISGVGFFGGKSARVLWVGTRQENENLLQLQSDLDEQLALIGFSKDNRKFSAHLTLCRIRNTKAGFKLAQLTKEYENYCPGNVPVDSICVYQSELTKQGPVYTLLGNYKLQ